MITTIAKLRSGHVWTCFCSIHQDVLNAPVCSVSHQSSPRNAMDEFPCHLRWSFRGAAILLSQKHVFSSTAYGAMPWIPSHAIWLDPPPALLTGIPHSELPNKRAGYRIEVLGMMNLEPLWNLKLFIESVPWFCRFMVVMVVIMSSRYQRNGKSRVGWDGMVVGCQGPPT